MAFCCNFCGKTSDHMQVCGKCLSAAYCGRVCQASDWNEHRSICSYRESATFVNDELVPLAVWHEYANIRTKAKKALAFANRRVRPLFYGSPTVELLQMDFHKAAASVAVLVFPSLTSLVQDIVVDVADKMLCGPLEDAEPKLEVYTVAQFDAQVAASSTLAPVWDGLPRPRRLGFLATKRDDGKLLIWGNGQIDLDGL